MVRERGMLTLRYLTRTEAHTFAFSVAANAILSFFPFMMLIMWLIRNVFHSQTMFDVVVQLLRDHLPTNQDYVIRNLDSMVRARQRVKFASIAILLITSTGVFLPLEVAFNQIWGFTKNRSYLGNQIISLLLAFGCGLLAMASIGLAAGNQWVVQVVMFGHKNVVSDLIAEESPSRYWLPSPVSEYFFFCTGSYQTAKSVPPAFCPLPWPWALSGKRAAIFI